LLNFQPEAQRGLDKLSSGEKQSVFRQLSRLLYAEDPYLMPFVEMLQEKKFSRAHKFRVGDYRISFVVEVVPITHLNHTYAGTLFVLDIRNRKDAY
jgi:mRNA-degrading endonuclease RelE of RelBE toxin-antitoxin system